MSNIIDLQSFKKNKQNKIQGSQEIKNIVINIKKHKEKLVKKI